jgi:Domain of unknown function (DUF4397)
MRHFTAACVLFVLFILTGCGSEEGFVPVSPPSGLLRVLNAIPDSPGLIINFENQPIGFIEFGNSSAVTQVLPEVTRSVRVTFIDNRIETLLISANAEITVDNLLTVVVAGTMAAPELILINDAPPEFAEGATTSEARFVHAATASTSVVDFHFTASDAPLGASLASVSRNSATELIDVEANASARLRVLDSDRITLWDSGAFSFAALARPLFVLLDYFGPGETLVRSILVGSTNTSKFPSELITSSLRFANMISDRTAIDMYLDDTLLAEDLLFGDVGSYQNLDEGDYEVTVTTANSVDDVIAVRPVSIVSGEFHTVIATGVGDLNGTLNSRDDLRRVASRSNVAFSNVAPAATSVDLYILQSTQTVDNSAPSITGLRFPQSESIRIIDGTYELTLTQGGTRNIVFGPEQITVEPNGLYRVYFADSAGGGDPIQLILGDEFTPGFDP